MIKLLLLNSTKKAPLTEVVPIESFLIVFALNWCRQCFQCLFRRQTRQVSSVN